MQDFQSEILGQSRLVELVKTLQPEEKAQILQYITVPLFNNGRMRAFVGPLLDICMNHPWQDVEQRLDKKGVFAVLFPGQEFQDGKLEKVMVEAYKFVRSCLLANNYFRAENEFTQTLDFAEIIRMKGLKVRYQQSLSRLKKMQEDFPWDNATYLHRQFLLEDAIHDDACFHNLVKGDLNVPNTLQYLDRYYQINRLELLNRFLLQQKVANLEVPESIRMLIEESHLPDRYLEESPAIRINNEIFKLLRKKHSEPSDVRMLFDMLLFHEKNLSPTSLREFYAYLRNLCTLISNRSLDDEEIRITLHELYKDNLARGYLHYEGKLHPSLYLAVSMVAVRVKAFDWALAFIENHKHDIISENESQDIYHFNLAYYLFGVGKFSECLDYIPATSPFLDYMLHGKRLELKAYYELQSDLLSYKLDAFKMFLSRTSQKLLSNTQKQVNVEFANLLTQLITSIPGDQKRADIVIKRVEEKKQAAEWRWLLTKAKALKNTHGSI